MSLAIYLLVAFIANLSQNAQASQENAVDLVSTKGLHMQFPYFEDFKQMDPELKTVVVPNVNKILGFLSGVIEETLANKGKRSLVSWAKVGWDLWSLGQEYAQQRKKLRKESGTSPEFNVQMKNMFKKLLSESNKLEQEFKARMEPKNFEELSVRSKSIFDSVIQTIEENPVAIYFDWRNGSIDGVPLETALIEFIAKLRYHGFGGALGAVEKLVNFVFLKSSKGWK